MLLKKGVNMLEFNDKDLEWISDRAQTEWKAFSGANASARAYTIAVCIWLKEKGVLDRMPEFKKRILAIDDASSER